MSCYSGLFCVCVCVCGFDRFPFLGFVFNLHSHQQCIRGLVPNSLNSVIILYGFCWWIDFPPKKTNLVIIFICISLILSVIEHLFSCLNNCLFFVLCTFYVFFHCPVDNLGVRWGVYFIFFQMALQPFEKLFVLKLFP